MSTNQDVVKPSEQLLRNLIYEVNGFHLPAEATFGLPQSYTPLQGDPNQADTSVLVSIQKPGCSGDRGSKWLYYKRMKLSALQALNPVGLTMTLGAPFTLSSILPLINAYYGINLDVTDIVDATYTVGQGPYALQAAVSSLAWEGQVGLPVVMSLAALCPVTTLGAFTAAGLLSVHNLSGFKEYVN